MTNEQNRTLSVDAAVIALADKYSETWRDKDDAYWFYRVNQEVGELGSVLAGDHDDAKEWELMQIAAMCINWLRMDAPFGFAFSDIENARELLK